MSITVAGSGGADGRSFGMQTSLYEQRQLFGESYPTAYSPMKELINSYMKQETVSYVPASRRTTPIFSSIAYLLNTLGTLLLSSTIK
jgi:hypothetical protein